MPTNEKLVKLPKITKMSVEIQLDVLNRINKIPEVRDRLIKMKKAFEWGIRKQSRRDFIEHFASSLIDPLEKFVFYPSESCNQHCDGWEFWLKDNSLFDMLREEIEENLQEIAESRYENEDSIENYVERRMDNMTNKKAVKLLGKEYLEESYPICPYRSFCNYYEGSE